MFSRTISCFTSSSSRRSLALLRAGVGGAAQRRDGLLIIGMTDAQRSMRLYSTADKQKEDDEVKGEVKQSGHGVRNDGVEIKIDPEEQKIQEAFMEHQQAAPKLGFPVDVRTLVQYNHGFAVMSTNSKANPGFPGGSVVGFAPDDEGRPLFTFSGMSSQTQYILLDSRSAKILREQLMGK